MKRSILYITIFYVIALAVPQLWAVESESCAARKAQKRFFCDAGGVTKECQRSQSKLQKCKEKKAVRDHNVMMQNLPEVVCSTVYQPVCAMTCGGGTASFSSECEAQTFGATVMHEGLCEVSCAAIYSPVCAINYYGSLETYSSTCEASVSGASVVHRKPCVSDSE